MKPLIVKRRRTSDTTPPPDTTVSDTSDDDQTSTSPSRTGWWARRVELKKLAGQFDTYPHLLALKPKERYVFHSDYFDVDTCVASILTFVHDDAAHDNFAPFWGIDRIPDGLDETVTAVVIEEITRMTDKWVDGFVKQSEKLDRLDQAEQDESGTMSSRRKSQKVSADVESVIAELQDGASYLTVHMRLLVKAPDVDTLDEAISKIARLYIDRFGTLRAAPYAGEQRQELSTLWARPDKTRGKGFHFTSTELAGSHSLVTNGVADPTGEYVGYMVGDVNNSAVLFDTNGYDHHVVIADGTFSDVLDRQHIANLWCSKLSQSCMLNSHSVVHLILDGVDLSKLGPAFTNLTSRVDLNSGDVNMFEMFGDPSDELSIFAAQMEKLKLMFDQLYEFTDGAVSSIIRSALEDTATDFYVEQRMWRPNAQEQRDRLRVVGIPHTQVPRLQMFVSYLATAHKALVNAAKTDPDQLRAYNVLRGIATSMLSTNGDLFNNYTTDAIDGVRDAKRVVYDFSKLMRRGKGVAMAQLVNIVGFAVGTLGLGDTVIIHGTEHIDDRVKKYMSDQFTHLHERGGRVVYSYNDVDAMLADHEFNRFDAADFTVFGPMRDRTVARYTELLHQQIPPDLASLITTTGENLSYLRRGVTNVVFYLDLALGVNPNREDQRRQIRREADLVLSGAASTLMTATLPSMTGR